LEDLERTVEVRPMELVPAHGAHRVVAQGRFPASAELWQVVSWLNRALRDRDLVFGVHREDGADVLTVYDARPRPQADGPEEATEGGSGPQPD
jgi:hypothetical protein